jgi:hypothetical protein
VNTALRAVHETLGRSGDPARVWQQLVRALRDVPHGRVKVDANSTASGLRAVGVHAPAGEWLIHLRLLGVVGPDGDLDGRAAEEVAVALRLVGDSFAPVGPLAGWDLVVTLPPGLRDAMRPPALPQTGGVLLELLERATDRLALAAPFVDRAAVDFVAPSLVDAGHRGADVRILTSPGALPAFDGLVASWATVPTGVLRLTEVATVLSPLGSHAKVVVVDGTVAYIGSANLTTGGLARHIEIGVKVFGPQVADLERLLLAVERLGTPRYVSSGLRSGR